MDDQNVIRTMEHKRRFGRLPGIKLSETLLAAVGNPQKGAAFIHIAGTNGKGSTAAFLREICTRAGIRTGLFTSPHPFRRCQARQAAVSAAQGVWSIHV